MAEAEYGDFVAEVETLLRHVSASVRKRGRAILVNFDVTPVQFDALTNIDRAGDLTIGDLSARLGLAYSTTTDLVDRMEQRGYVQRVRDAADKRVVRVRALASGRAVIEEVLAARRAYLSTVLDRVADADRQTLLSILQLLDRRLRGV